MRRLLLAILCCFAILGTAALVLSRASEDSFAGLNDPQAEAVLRRAFGHGVTPSDGRLLYDLILQKGYKRALDIGTAQGYSSAWFGLAMKKNGGRLVTIEIDPGRAAEARKNFQEAGLADFIESRVGDALLVIPELKGDFDFVFMDTGVPLNKKFLDLLYPRITPGGAITAHNANSFVFRQPDFLKAIQTDPSLETKIVPTTSGGISLTIKKGAKT
jgi:predicted O-methyltransferase YrrM